MKRVALLAGALTMFGAGKALAETCGGMRPEIVPQVSFVTENDMFNGTNDRNYSSGLQTSVMLPPPRWQPLQDALDRLTPTPCHQGWAYSLSLTNQMFTPTDLTLDPPSPNDRPYAGVTALTLAAFTFNDKHTAFDDVGLSLGIIGPDSGSDGLQSWWHRSVLHIGAPAGWSAQLPDYPLVQVTYQHTSRLPFADDDGGFAFDIFANYGFGAGTLLDYGHLGVGARLGWNIAGDFGPPRIEPSMHGSGYWSPSPSDPYFGGYVFIDTDERYVLYDRTIDGRPATGVSDVEHRDFVNDTQWGWVAHVGGVRLAGVYVWRSRQFRQQNQGDSFGSYSVTFSLRLEPYLLKDSRGNWRPMLRRRSLN